MFYQVFEVAFVFRLVLVLAPQACGDTRLLLQLNGGSLYLFEEFLLDVGRLSHARKAENRARTTRIELV